MEALGWIVALLVLGVGAVVFISFSRRCSRLTEQLEVAGTEFDDLRRRMDRERSNEEALLASMIEGVMVVDREHIIRLVNASLVEMFELAASPLRSTVLSALREAAIEEILTAALESGTPQTGEISILPRTRGAALRHCAISAVPLRDNGGGDSGVVVVFHDITRLRRLEEIRREFVANVSHELRTPLSIFHGYLENLLDNPAMPHAELGAILAVMKRHSLRLNALLDDLLTLARLESANETLELTPIDLPKFLSRIVEEWRPRFQEKKLTVEIRTASGLSTLKADAFRLDQVFSNLLENATKFTDPGGRITLAAEAVGGEIVLRVGDSGIGIPPADLPHIFERFYRVEKARSREAGGTGLGLSIVKHIASLHKGSVAAESVPGRGTTITVRLPGNV